MSSFKLDPSAFREIKLFVGNIPFTSSEEEVRDLFMTKGLKVSVVKIPRLPNGRSKGFGFVVFLSDDPARDILDLYGVQLSGRPLRIALSQDTRDEMKGQGAL